MLYVLNYADGEPFKSYQKINTKTSKWFGKADEVIEYSSKDIPQSYKDAHSNIFKYKRGAGLWLWKPFIINKVLNIIDDGDWLLYLDAGTTVIRDLNYIVDHTKEQGLDIFLMEQPLLSRQFTKRECYIKMGLEDHGENQVLGLLLLLRKSSSSVKFVNEWLQLCEDEEMISPNIFHPEIEEFPDFCSHREDQSVLNLLRLKYKIPVFRDCSAHGEMPYLYCYKDTTYNPKDYNNSKYPTVILCNRAYNPYKYFLKYILKKILIKCHVTFFIKRCLYNPPSIPKKK